LRLIHGKDTTLLIYNALSKTLILAGVLLLANSAVARDVKFSLGIDADWIEQKIDVEEDNSSISSSNQIIKPYTQISYLGRDIRASLTGTHNHVRRQLDSENITQNYPELRYSGSYDAIEGLLNFSVNGSQSYRSEGIGSFLVDDFLLNGDNLNKVTSQQASVTLNLPRADIFGLTASAFYRNNKSDRNENGTSSIASLFDSKSHGASFNIISGESLDGIRSTITGNYNYVERDTQQDFVSHALNIDNSVKIYGSFGIALNASYEDNDIKSNLDQSQSRLREFYSVGAGLVWQSSIDRFLEVAYNRSFRESPDENSDTEENNFVSYKVNWAFSERTSLQANFTKRFFGDAGNVSFIHQLRNWRSSVTYNESVNTTSQLANSSDVALFICDGGSTNIADCQLSDSLTPDLGVGQVLQPIVFQNFELNDRVILSKNLTAQSAVTRRRTTLSVTATKSKIDEFEFDQAFETTGLQLQVLFNISQRTNLTLTSSYSKIETVDTAEPETQTTNEQSIDLTHQLTRQFSASIGLRYLDREGDLIRGDGGDFRGLSGPLSDQRISFRVSYQFGKGY
jgi:uncharacterized protein (PEP-CTERM system associated)